MSAFDAFPQFEPHAIPCESCGTLVRIGMARFTDELDDDESAEEAFMRHWASGVVTVRCTDCGGG